MNGMFTKFGLSALAVLSGFSAFAGNVPQYRFEYNVQTQEETNKVFTYLQGGTQVVSAWDGDNIIFGDGVETREARKGPGFEIGFPFRFAGREFTHFAINNCGVVYFGDADGVEFRGMNTMTFQRSLEFYRHMDSSFYTGINYAAVEHDLDSYHGGEIYYKTEGREGDRTLTVEYRNIRINGQKSTQYTGLFDLQIILHEKDGRIDCLFNEVSTPADSRLYLIPGLRGWDTTDQMILTSPSLSAEPKWADARLFELTDRNTSVRWDGENDYDHFYLVRYSFIPEDNKTAPAEAPANLQALQDGKSLRISCNRAENSPATIILVSETPFDSESLPKDGLTYGVCDPRGDYVYKIGNATIVYYGDDASPVVTWPDAKANQDYYIAAISANGYPAYNVENANIITSKTAQAAPSELNVSTGEPGKIKLKWVANDPVIIASTLECNRAVAGDYRGKFGIPSENVKPGDKIVGGGEVVYVGDGNEVEIDALENNKMHYFAAWTLKDGVLSSVFTPAHGTTIPSLPFEPAYETYPGWITPEGLESPTLAPETIGIVNRGSSKEPAFRIYLVGETPVEFSLPEISHTATQDLEMEFEFALETDRGFEEAGGGAGGPSVQLPLGNEAGHFDEGSLRISCNGALVKEITEYNGTMESNGESGWVSGSSTYEPVKFTLPVSQDNVYRVAFRGLSTETSVLYLRKIKIAEAGSGVGEIVAINENLLVASMPGKIILSSSVAQNVKIYSLDGLLISDINVAPGKDAEVMVGPGIYIVNGKKICIQ